MQQHKDFRLRLPKFISHVHQASQDLEGGDFFRGKLKNNHQANGKTTTQ